MISLCGTEIGPADAVRGSRNANSRTMHPGHAVWIWQRRPALGVVHEPLTPGWVPDDEGIGSAVPLGIVKERGRSARDINTRRARLAGRWYGSNCDRQPAKQDKSFRKIDLFSQKSLG
jgi:hypothetical protein